MAYYYVKSPSGGTPTSYATIQTSWPANYYTSIAAAITGGATSSDVIMVSDAHDHDYGATTTIGMNGHVAVCVSDTNPDQLSTGAVESASTGAYDLIIIANTTGASCYCYGIEFQAYDDILIADSSATYRIGVFEKCVFTFEGTGSSSEELSIEGDGSCAYLYDCDVNGTNMGKGISPGYGGKWVMRGGSITTSNNICDGLGNGGQFYEFDGVDFSGCASGTTLFATLAETIADAIIATCNRCKLNASFTFFPSTPSRINYRAEGQSLNAGTGYWNQRIEDGTGTLTDSGTIYRTSGATYDGTNEYSVRVDTTANCNRINPFRFRLGSVSLDAADTPSTLTVHLARDDGTSVDFKDNEIWIDVMRPDATSYALGDFSTSTQGAKWLATSGNDLTTETGLWTGAVDQQMSISSGSIAHGTGIVDVWVNVAITSQTAIYFCPKIEVS